MMDEKPRPAGEPGRSGGPGGASGAPGATTCDDALQAFLEAEPSELRGEGESALAAHVRTCPRCAAVAGELVAGEGALARALEGMAPVAPGAGDDALPRTPGREGKGRPREWWRWAAPLAAAAAAAGLLVIHGGERATIPPGVGEGAARPEAGRGDPFRVSAPEGRDVVVFETGEPDITVVWLY